MEENKRKELAEAGLVQALRSITKEECTAAYLDERITEDVVGQVSKHIKDVLRAFEAARQYANEGLGKSYAIEVRVDATGIRSAMNSGSESEGMGPLPSHFFVFGRFLKGLIGKLASFANVTSRKNWALVLGERKLELSIIKGASLRITPKAVQGNYGEEWKWRKVSGRLSIDLSKLPNPHMLVVGSSGYGKSTMLGNIARQIGSYRIPIVLFDAHGEHTRMVSKLGGVSYDASESGINILALDGLTGKQRAREVSSTLTNIYSLGYLQKLKLDQCLTYLYRKFGGLQKEPSVKDLLTEIHIFIKMSNSATERNRLYQIRDRVEELDYSAFTGNSIPFNKVASGITSFDLSKINGSNAKMIYIEELLKRIYQRMPYGRAYGIPRMYIIIDEGRSMLDKSHAVGGMVNSIIEEGRKFGYGVILAAHNASELSKQIVSNAGTFIAFRSKEPSDINYIANIVSGGMQNVNEIKSMIGSLGVGSAIVSGGSIERPVVVRVPNGFEGHNAAGSVGYGLIEKLTKPIRVKDIIEEGGASASSELYSALNSGLAETFMFDGKNRKELWVARKSNQSAEHLVMVQKLFDAISASGIECGVFNRSGTPDLVAYQKGRRIAVEYETGKKNLIESAGMIYRRSKSYDKVIVVVNDGSVQSYSKVGSANVVVISASEAIESDWNKLIEI